VDSAVFDTQLNGADPVGLLLAAPRCGASGNRSATRQEPPDSQLPNPARLGRRMAALYATWQHGRLPDMEGLAKALLHRNGVPSDDPLARTCCAAARSVEAWGGLAYHSATHHAEVATNAMILVALADRLGQPLGWRAAAILLAAGLAHDLHYRPGVTAERFAAEAASADALDTIAAAQGCSDADRRAMRALIIATEPGLRLRPGGPLGAPLEATAARLIGQDSVDPALARLAAMLSDADLLSSVGLTAAWYHVQLARLETEAGKPHDPADSARFFTAIVGPDFVSLPGRMFSPNLSAIRRAVNRTA